MSPTVNNFVHDLVAMAKAMEDLPQVQAQLDEALKHGHELADIVAKREATIIRLKAEIEAHLETIRRTEVERDQAETMFLELDEKTHSVLSMVRASQVGLDKAVLILDPPKPEPTPEPVKVEYTATPVSEGQSADPLSPASADTHSIPAQADHSTVPTSDSGVSVESLPTPAPSALTSDTPNDAGPVPATPEAVGSTGTDAGGGSWATPAQTDGIGRQLGEPPALDDVGYHNEPQVNDNNWSEWDRWATRMNARYGNTSWPQRPKSFPI